MIKMLKVKEILLRFQEDTKFIEKVAKSNTIDKLYEVFCEYEYDSDINSFESEIYELLSNSDLVKESIDEEELERISGRASTRAKIMSVIALSSLAMGGIAPITHVDAANVVPNQKNTTYSHVEVDNVATKRKRKTNVDTLLPPPEWKALGATGLVGTLVLVFMRLWNKSTKKPSVEQGSDPREKLCSTDVSHFNTFNSNTQLLSQIHGTDNIANQTNRPVTDDQITQANEENNYSADAPGLNSTTNAESVEKGSTPRGNLSNTDDSRSATFNGTAPILSRIQQSDEKTDEKTEAPKMRMLKDVLGSQEYNDYLNDKKKRRAEKKLKFIDTLKRIRSYYEYNDTAEKFPQQLLDDMTYIRDVIFYNGIPEKRGYDDPEKTTLLAFPPDKNACLSNSKRYFAPISNIGGKPVFDTEDQYMLSKVIFQYLSRILCLTLIYSGPSYKNYGCQKLVNCLSGYDENTSDNPVCYKDLLNPAGIDNKFDWEKYPFHDEIPALCRTLRLMCSNAETEGKLNEKCGVYGVKGTRGNVN